MVFGGGVVFVRMGGGCCIRVMMWLFLFILASLGSQLFFTDSDVVRFFKFRSKMGLYICGSISLTWRFLVEVLEVSFIGRGNISLYSLHVTLYPVLRHDGSLLRASLGLFEQLFIFKS